MDHHKWETWTDQRSMQCKLDHKPRPLPVAMRVHYSTDVLAGKGGVQCLMYTVLEIKYARMVNK